VVRKSRHYLSDIQLIPSCRSGIRPPKRIVFFSFSLKTAHYALLIFIVTFLVRSFSAKMVYYALFWGVNLICHKVYSNLHFLMTWGSCCGHSIASSPFLSISSRHVLHRSHSTEKPSWVFFSGFGLIFGGKQHF